MTLRTALILAFAMVLTSAAIVFAGLLLLGVGSEAFALAYVLVLCVGAYSVSAVAIHYWDRPSSRRHR